MRANLATRLHHGQRVWPVDLTGRVNRRYCIAVAALNGIPLGAKWLADDILADVIDYDEFLTGNRAEATYTMFKSFLPKVASIPASAIPITLLVREKNRPARAWAGLLI